jgi:hypothetical protein
VRARIAASRGHSPRRNRSSGRNSLPTGRD